MEVAWVEACEGGLEVGGEERAALVLGLVGGGVVATPAAATAAAKEELGGGCWCRSNTRGRCFSECSQVHWGGLWGHST